jgi:Rho GTPase-activating protein 1
VLLRKLDEFVARDYVLLFFGGGMQHKPSLGWMISAYKSLTRSYKKNIKHLYVVHPTWWFSFVIWLMATIVSDKFAKKIVMIKKLSLLPVHVPMQSLVIPELVKRHDERRGNPPVANASALTTPIAGNRQRASTGVRHTQRRRGEVIFGGELVSQDPELESAPEAVDSLISYLQQNGVNEVEIFRTSPATSDIAELKDRLNRGTSLASSSIIPCDCYCRTGGPMG